MSKSKISVLGSLIYDCVIWADRLPTKGETVIGYKNGFFPGGKGANQAVQAARIGADVAMIGKVGNDQTGDHLINELIKDGINVENISKDEKTPTSTCAIFVDNNGDNMIVTAPQANLCMKKSDIDAALSKIKEADVFLTQLETNYDVIYYALELAKISGITTVLNPAPAGDVDTDIFQYVDYITPNETEAEHLTGIYREGYSLDEWAEKASNKFLDMGIKNVIITLGEKGASFCSKDKLFFQPPYKVDAVDSTAAGDSFNGAFAYALSLNMGIEEAIKLGCAAGAITASKEGAQTSIPKKEELLDFMDKADDKKTI